MLILKNVISVKLWNVKRDIKRVHSKLNVMPRIQFKIINKAEFPNETMFAHTLNLEINKRYYKSEINEKV